MLVGLKRILGLAEEKQFAVPAFNIYNMETVMGVIEAACENGSPVILQVYSRLFTEGGARFLAPVVLEAARSAPVPVAFHIDHGAGKKEILRAVRYGCSSVMIDASMLPFEENVRTTREIVDIADSVGIEVEGELGHVGLTSDAAMDVFTVPEEAEEYVKRTGVFALAVLAGNAHGRYQSPPSLDLMRIGKIRERAGVPLVLHGGSGIPDVQVKEAIQAGIRKVNFGTDLCYSFLDGVFATSREIIAIDAFMKKPVTAVRAFAASKMELLESVGKG